MFYDRATIQIKAGNGGDGSASFRREKFVPKGGPDGGDGGRGGSIYLRVNPDLNTLLSFHYKQHYKASHGGSGGGRHKHGKAGQDLYIDVPPGTFVEIIDENPVSGSASEVSQTDLLRPGQTLLVARGGRGGLGNLHFTTSTQQTPRFAEKGEPGDERTIHMELKLIADVGLVGYPNVGKSTLLSTVSAAQPKIGDYPFTTLAPMLGVVSVDDDTFVMADIPGLIEGASSGAGLGLEFLRHVERARLLLHIVDGSAGLWNAEFGVGSAENGEEDDGRRTTDDPSKSELTPHSALPTPPSAHPSQTTDPIGDFKRINAELQEYDATLADRPQIVAINKADLQEVRDRLPSLIEQFLEMGYEVYPISAATGDGVQELLRAVAARLRELPKSEWGTEEAIAEEEESVLVRPHYASESKYFKVIEEEKGRYRVTGSRIERLAVVTDANNRYALERLDREMEKMGVSTALRAAGIEPGDTVVIGRIEMDWGEESWANFARGTSRRKRREGPGKQKS
ncbi:MAG TPA: GTPase ObgE [Chloroflexia bacterium]|nr:GTPase ObgE [Chloroflexia bacterium]